LSRKVSVPVVDSQNVPKTTSYSSNNAASKGDPYAMAGITLEEFENLKQIIEELQTELEAQRNKSEETVQSMNSKLQALQKERDHFKAEASKTPVKNAASNDIIQDLQNDLQRTKESLKNLVDQTEKKNSLIKQLTIENQRLQERNKELEMLSKPTSSSLPPVSASEHAFPASALVEGTLMVTLGSTQYQFMLQKNTSISKMSFSSAKESSTAPSVPHSSHHIESPPPIPPKSDAEDHRIVPKVALNFWKQKG
jgi:myosin heavy subunit